MDFLTLLVPALMLGGLYALIAVGLNLVYGTTGFLNVAHGEFMMLGGYAAFWGFTLWGVSPLVAAVVVAALAALAGALLYLGPLRYLVRVVPDPEAREFVSLLFFFGLLIALQNIAAALWSGDLRGYTYLERTFAVLGARVTTGHAIAFAVAVVLCSGIYLLLRYTTLGKAIRAVIQDRTGAQVTGINPDVIYLVCMALGFAITGVAGVLVSVFRPISPFVGLDYTVIAFITVILGGLGNFGGTLLAAFLLAVLETLGVHWISPGLQSVITYSVFLVVLLSRPAGLFGKVLKGR